MVTISEIFIASLTKHRLLANHFMSNSTENTITCIFLTKHLAIYKKMLTFAHIITDKEWR